MVSAFLKNISSKPFALDLMTAIACLPPSILWAASFAASTDGSKGPICAIEARRQGDDVRIVAVDGHRCFLCLVPTSTGFHMPEEPIRLSPKAFSKAPSRKVTQAVLNDSGVVQFQDRHGLVASSAVWTADPWALSEQAFPNIDQLWPSSELLVCKPGTFMAFTPRYVADFMKIADKLGANDTVRMLSQDQPVAPTVWQTVLDNGWLGMDSTEEVWLNYLLMPKLVRGQ